MANPLYVGFSASNGVMGRLIRYFTGGTVNHAFLAWQDDHLGWVVLGANSNGVTLDTWHNFIQSRTVAGLYSPVGNSLWTGLEQLQNDINASYDTAALIGMSVVEIANHIFHKNISNPLDVDHHDVFCSEFATMVIRASGIPFLGDKPADTIDPEAMMKELDSRRDFVKTVLA